MSVAAERARASLVEPDRLDGFSSPREVDRVFGHGEAIAEFAAALVSGRMHHAWLLVGPEGVGKATLAYAFARRMLAQSGESDIPVDHPVFRKVAGLAHPNLLLIRRSWIEKTKRYSQWIGVDEVRRLRAFLGHSAGESGWRVVIVDRADELNQNAANALLKALEEPPPQTLFLLISSAEGRLPVTIRSRTRTLRVSGLGEEDLERAARAALERDGQKADAKALKLALALSQGSVRRALELVTSDGIALYEDIVATFSGLPDLDGARLHKQVERLSGAGDTERLELYLSLMIGLIERLIRHGATGEGAAGETERELAKQLVSKDNLARWAEAWETISAEKAEAFALNLDRSLLVLDAWFRLQRLAREHPVYGTPR
ncbi:MAG: DNA polymerase III subunit delta' [Methyloceanibacter sp.]|uniref:DNA polymerase III subunit delta' n=1 Tax=Methyloceanibacter sp. TaxID=1965321 RepID=UPI003D6D0342